jgi:hypothetical protein
LRIFSIFNQVFEAQTQQHRLLIHNFLKPLVLYLKTLMVRFCAVAPFLHRIGPFFATVWAWAFAPQK